MGSGQEGCGAGPHHGNEPADEAEIGEVVRVDGGSRVDLQAVIVLPGILEETVHGVEHLMGQEEEPLPGGREMHWWVGSHRSDMPFGASCLQSLQVGLKMRRAQVANATYARQFWGTIWKDPHGAFGLQVLPPGTSPQVPGPTIVASTV